MSVYLTIFGKPRYLGLARIDDSRNFDEKKSRWIVLKTSRGIEMGMCGGKISKEQEEQYKIAGTKFEETQDTMLQDVDFIKTASQSQIEAFYKCRRDEENALVCSRKILAEHELDLKLVDVEYMLDRKKFYFYFTAEQRVDFRAYVRDLAHEFKTRIEMRQVGIRDEARIVRGIASCGRPCCCGYWLRGFSPIGIKMVKEQRLALNPTKISGLCGRLMCCMSYEQALYSELWSKLPGPGAKIKTEQGVYTLESLDISHERVHIRFPSGRLVPVSISEFPDFQEAVLNGKEWGDEESPKPITTHRTVRILRGSRFSKSNTPGKIDKNDKNDKNRNERKSKVQRQNKSSKSGRSGNFKRGGKKSGPKN